MRIRCARLVINSLVSLLWLGLGNMCLLDAQPHFACIEELTIPKYPALARQARLQGNVEVRVAFNEFRRPIKTIITGAAPLLRQAVAEALGASRFSVSCPANEFTLVFAFELDLEAPPRTFDEGTVVVRGTGVIVIRAVRFPLSGSTTVPP